MLVVGIEEHGKHENYTEATEKTSFLFFSVSSVKPLCLPCSSIRRAKKIKEI
jgi:hypothetical protein